ncbi:hypothetical protein [Hungatella effluvii]|uniref:hypothetical protein n=1 Tax=Hungatella effluvii TaxID=1096246 RepID=UPI0022E3978C|nr:hypothetical protein [Hungatella effluvii]
MEEWKESIDKQLKITGVTLYECAAPVIFNYPISHKYFGEYESNNKYSNTIKE